MKTLLEVKNEWVKTQIGYGFDKEDGQFSNWNEWYEGGRTISEQDLHEISKMFAEQALDFAALTVELDYDSEYNKESYNLPPSQIIDCCDGQSNDMIVFINKDSILSLKYQLK